MKNEVLLKTILFEGTLLVKKLINREIGLEQFIEQYADFYYYNALDGHEANEQDGLLLKKYEKVVELHEKIQTNVINLLYNGDLDKLPLYLAAGRIRPEHALKRITDIANLYNIDAILEETKLETELV